MLADGIGFSPVLGAFGVALIFQPGSVFGLARRRGTGYDSLTALVLVGCLAAGVILASDVYHSGSNVEQLLFGSLLLFVHGADIRLAAVAAVAIVIANVAPSAVAGSPQDSTSSAAPTLSGGWLEVVLLLGLIALATTAALSVIGAPPVAAIFVAPAATVRLFANRMLSWQIASRPARRGRGHRRTWLSVKTNAPPGATIATLSGAVFGVAAGVRAIGPRRWGWSAAAGIAVALAGRLWGLGSDSGKLEWSRRPPNRRLLPPGRRQRR